MTLDITIGTSEAFTNECYRRMAVVEKHVLTFFESEEEFKDEISNIMRSYGVIPYKAIGIAIDAGFFLVYYEDIKNFMREEFGLVVTDNEILMDSYKANLCYFGSQML